MPKNTEESQFAQEIVPNLEMINMIYRHIASLAETISFIQ